MADETRGRDWLSRTLRDLRTAAGLNQTRAASMAGVSQSRISRIEVGVFMPTSAEITALCDAYHAPAKVRRQLLQAAADTTGTTPARVIMSRGAWRMQQRIARIEAGAADIRVHTTSIVPGLMQTPGYARLVFADGGDITGEDLDQAVASRMSRATVLGSGCAFTFVVTEGALRWQAGSPAVMIDQLQHIAAVTAAWPHVRFGIIPFTQPARVFTLHGFTMYDGRTVLVGTRTASAFITDAGDVADYAKLFADLESLALFGDDAARLMDGLAAEYAALA